MKTLSINILSILAFAIFLTVGVPAQTQQCFESDGLKEKQQIAFVITGNKVEGTFQKSGYDDANPAQTIGFFGTKSGNRLTIKFPGETPYEAPKAKTIVWTISGKTLKVPMYGKNYDTNKYSAYISAFNKCE